MKLIEVLSQINKIAISNNISVPFIVGGTARDKVMNRLDHIVDLDITNGDNSILSLGQKISKAIPQSNYKKFPDGHSQIIIEKFKIDLSSNFLVPNIKNILIKAGLNNPNNMQCELYSRDFTCNALLLSLDLKNIYDPTGLGINDIKKKIIRTCLPAQLTLGSQHKRVARIIYLACKLNFEVDEEIISWVKKNPNSLIDECKEKYVKDKLQKAIFFNKNKAVKLLDTMNLWSVTPIISELIPYMNNKRI